MPVARRPRPNPRDYPGAARFLPALHTLPAMREAVQACRGCPLYQHATQAVFGEGPAHARVVLVGEQPGDSEDRAGRPFVGPAGRLLDEALAAGGIARDDVYITNAVKHFKFTLRGKRRIHDKPTRYETRACQPWLGEELAVIAPDVIVPMGATAAQALLGDAFRVTQHRGEVLEEVLDGAVVIATVHPASVLRAPDDETRDKAKADLFADFERIGDQMRAAARRRAR